MTATVSVMDDDAGLVEALPARVVRYFEAQVADWEDVCSALGRWELQHRLEDGEPEVLAHHRRAVDEILKVGRWIQHVTSSDDFPSRTLARRVSQRVTHLEDKLALWHGDAVPAERVEAMLAPLAR